MLILYLSTGGWGPMRRYAKGEIAKEEYERMKKDLEG